jgi:hypothetical protein
VRWLGRSSLTSCCTGTATFPFHHSVTNFLLRNYSCCCWHILTAPACLLLLLLLLLLLQVRMTCPS